MLQHTAPALAEPRTEDAPALSATPGVAITVRGVSRLFADGTGLQPVDLDIQAGEFVSVLGPSGCGKSTLLRCLAGLETPQSGTISFGQTMVFDAASARSVPVRRRGLGMVFQDLALWPHLSASENVAFPLRVSRTPKQQIGTRVAAALELAGLAGFAGKLPHQLSGGQQQRVAIARAIVARPAVLLMDEPFSALDAALRLQLRLELRELTTRLGLTTVYVTHDQAEAMAMSDRIAVLERGVLRQLDSPEQLYLAPAAAFVADFIGQFNWLPGRSAGLRPESTRLREVADGITVTGTVQSCSYLGGRYALLCRVEGAAAPWAVEASAPVVPGQSVLLGGSEADLIRIDEDSVG